LITPLQPTNENQIGFVVVVVVVVVVVTEVTREEYFKISARRQVL